MVEVVAEDLDGLFVGLVSQLTTQFPLNRRSQEALIGILVGFRNEVRGGIPLLGPNEPEAQIVQHRIFIDRDLDTEDTLAFTPVDCHDLVRAHILHRGSKVVVLLVGSQLILVFAIAFQFGNQLAVVSGVAPQPAADRGHLTDRLGQDFVGPGQGRLSIRHARIDVFCRSRCQVTVRVGQEPVGQRGQTGCPGLLRLGLPLLLVRQVEVLHRLKVRGRFDLLLQVRGEFPLFLDLIDDGLLPFQQAGDMVILVPNRL